MQPSSVTSASKEDPFWLAAVACLVWCCSFGVVLEAVLAGRVEVVPFDTYMAAAERWLAHQPLYETRTIDGFQYFPQSALIFAPFAVLGPVAGAVCWRALWWALYAFGIWRVARLLASACPRRTFLIATCLAVGPATGSLGNGQANLALGALTLLVAADLSAQCWWRAALLLAGGLALKPLMAPLLLLVWVLYRPMTGRLLIVVIALALAPFLVGDMSYVLQQYVTCSTKLGMTSTPDRLFEDLRGLLASLGWLMPHPVYLVLRAVTAGAVLGICWLARRRVREPELAVLIAALAVGYLMLLNPRTLASSYTMTSSIAGLFTAVTLLDGAWAEALALASVAVAWAVNRHWSGFGFIQYWLKPAACLVFLGWAIRQAVTPSPRWKLRRAEPAIHSPPVLRHWRYLSRRRCGCS